MKKRVSAIDATPSKRLFLSIVADYDLRKAIAELVDNVLDTRTIRRLRRTATVTIMLDIGQQCIVVNDDVGGIDESELRLVVAPGQTNVDPRSQVIGIFGVGSKRAVIALSEQIRITSRRSRKGKTFRVEIDEDWLNDPDDWSLNYYQVDPVPAGTTTVRLDALRIPLDASDEASLRTYLGETYATFLIRGDLVIRLNGTAVLPIEFKNWAYPPRFSPRRYAGALKTSDGDTVRVEAIIGLLAESSSVGDWGVYILCNDRQIARAVKDETLGFTTGLIGKPHPDISLLRAEVRLKGPARAMPWNSTKSGLSQEHAVFRALRGWIVPVLKDWASLSRRLAGDWKTQIFPYTTGSFESVPVASFGTAGKSHLPPLPIAKPQLPERIKNANKAIASARPWTQGLYEGVAAAEVIRTKNFSQRNRLGVILLDSTLEIGLKEFLVNESGKYYSDKAISNLFSNRADVQREVSKFVRVPPPMWSRLGYFHNLRNKFVHERATVAITDSELDSFQEEVKRLLARLFKLRFDV